MLNNMRHRNEIEEECIVADNELTLMLEALLDIRDLLLEDKYEKE